MSITPQANILLDHLKSGGTLTQRSAHIDFSVGSLTKRMSELRDAGYNIIGEWETNHKTGQRFMRYRLGESAQVAPPVEPKKEFDKYVVVEDLSTVKVGDKLQFLEFDGKDVSDIKVSSSDWTGTAVTEVLQRSFDQRGRLLGEVQEIFGDVNEYISFLVYFPRADVAQAINVLGTHTVKVARLENAR